MITITAVLSLFTLLIVSCAVFFAAKRFNAPYTVLLVLVGLLLVPLAQLPYLETVFGFIDDLVLTPELLFYIFLPILIFESAFNMNIRRMIDNVWTISALAIVGLLISAFLIAALLYLVLPLIGIYIPFVVALLFGSIISATDPVAVLAMFKDFGAPKRLTMIFEGESLFNDGTAVALFIVVLAIADNGFNGIGTVGEGLVTFTVMVMLGILIGLVMAGLFSRALRFTRTNEFVSVTLLFVSAHLVFILGELINQSGFHVLGVPLHVSSIIAATVSSLFLGNYARHILSPKTDEYLGKSVEHLAFIANSLVFILAGVLFSTAKVDMGVLWLPILLAIVIVAIVRVISVYAVTRPLNALKLEAPIAPSWEVLLSWASLRGALAIIVVLLIPQDFTVAGWTLPYPPRDFLMALTIGCILATLFIKAPFIGILMRKLKVTEASPLTLAHEADLGIYYLLTEQSRFAIHKTRGFVQEEQYKSLKGRLGGRIEDAYAERDELVRQHGRKVFDQSLNLMAINIENNYLKQLYINEEVTESVYRRIKGKLNLQKEKIEYAQHDEIDPSLYVDRKDVFDRLVRFMHISLERKKQEQSIEERLQYYRAQMIISRKVIKTLRQMQEEFSRPVFLQDVYEKVIARYEKYKQQCADKVDDLLERHTEELAPYLGHLAEKSLAASGDRALSFLHSRGIVGEMTEHAIAERFGVKY